MVDILPTSRLKEPKNTVKAAYANMGLEWVPIFCANCGKDGGLVLDGDYKFAFYLCESCAEKWSPLVGTYMEPDAVFWEKVKQAQIEKYGRELTPGETLEALNDSNSIISKLARERSNFKPSQL